MLGVVRNLQPEPDESIRLGDTNVAIAPLEVISGTFI